MKQLFVMLICIIIIVIFFAYRFPRWMVGNDNGRAYEAYTEAMEEAGMPPERW